MKSKLLRAQAKITQDQASKTALTKVPNGTIKSAQLVKQHRKLVWLVEISTPKSKKITIVAVSAVNSRTNDDVLFQSIR
jgi:uncharacterized membrane protein YkoI